MNIDKRERRNCYNCERFGHMVRNCINRGIGNKIGEGRKLEYGRNINNEQSRMKGGNRQSNLNKEGDLIVFD